MKGVIIALCLFCTCGMLNAQNKLPKNGKHVYSYANGNDSIVCFYKNGRLVGQRTEYYPNGQIRLISTYKNGRKLNLKQYLWKPGALKREEVMNGRFFRRASVWYWRKRTGLHSLYRAASVSRRQCRAIKADSPIYQVSSAGHKRQKARIGPHKMLDRQGRQS